MSVATAETDARRSPSGFALPAVFVFLWATGFIGGKVGLAYAGPFTFLLLRFVIVVALLGVIALLTRAPWPERRAIGPLAVAGVLVHAGYLGGVFEAVSHGVEAGVASLVAGLQPVLAAALARPLLGERVSRRQWIGMLVGLAGVALVMGKKLNLGLGSPEGMGFAVLSMVSITLGALWQKRFCAEMDLRTGSVVQFAAAALVAAPLAWGEGFRVSVTTPFLLSLAWMCVVLSIGAVTAMFVLIRRGAAEVASLFFLVPPTTAAIAYVWFGETLDPLSLGGAALVVAAVALASSRPAP